MDNILDLDYELSEFLAFATVEKVAQASDSSIPQFVRYTCCAIEIALHGLLWIAYILYRLIYAVDRTSTDYEWYGNLLIGRNVRS